MTDREDMTNPSIGVFLGVQYKGLPLTSLHSSKNLDVSNKNGLHKCSLLIFIGALKPFAHGLLEFNTSNKQSILLIKDTVASTPSNSGWFNSTFKNSNALATLALKV